MKNFIVKKGIAFLPQSFFVSYRGFSTERSVSQRLLEPLTSFYSWGGRGVQIILAVLMIGIALGAQLTWILSSWAQVPLGKSILAHSLLLMIAYPFVRLMFFSADVKTMTLQCLGALVHFFILLGLGVWCQSWNLMEVISQQASLVFGLQFFPLLVLECIRHMIALSLSPGNGRWDQGQLWCDWSVFLISTNALFWGGDGRPFTSGGLVLKMGLMYGVLMWSSMSFIKLSPDQTMRALLKYLLPLSFSFFVIFLLARMVMIWLAL